MRRTNCASTPPARRRSRPRVEALGRRILPTGYYPAVGDYDGDGIADVAAFRYTTVQGQEVNGRNAVLMQPSATGVSTGYELGYAPADVPVVGDFDGDGKADPAVYGFLKDQYFGTVYYGTAAGVPAPFPAGGGRFAYVPSSGKYPATASPASVNGMQDTGSSRMVVVNLGGAGDVPAVGDYDGDGKADFAVYEPATAQFLYYPSSTFNPAANPAAPSNGPRVLAIGRPGDVPAPADYEGAGRDQFAVYDAASGTFTVLSTAGTVDTIKLGGAGDVPTPGDFEATGRADFAVYDATTGKFTYRPADGSAARDVAVGLPGDLPAVARYGGGIRDDFATFTPATLHFQVAPLLGAVATRSLDNPDAIPIQRTDTYAAATHAQYLALAGTPTVAFIGDSLTYLWPYNAPAVWATRMAQFSPLNLGVTGDTSQDLLWRLSNGELDHIRPRLVVLEVGTNDFVDRTPAQLAVTVRALLGLIHAKVPGVEVLLLGVAPRGRDSADDSPSQRSFDVTAEAEVRSYDQAYLPTLAPPFGSRNTANYPVGDFSVDLRPYLGADPADPNDYYVDPTKVNTDLVHPVAAGYASIAAAVATPLRLLLDRAAAAGDYDGDGVTDLAVYVPSTGAFLIRSSADGSVATVAEGPTGTGAAVPVPGDFDGDGRADPAVYVPSTGRFVLTASATGIQSTLPFGAAGVGGSIPAVADYDGDGKADLAVYLPALGAFGVRPSAGGPDVITPFGIAGPGKSIPVPGDYDGDGRADLAVYLPTLGLFAYRPSRGGADVLTSFGMPGQGLTVPVPGDFDGDGKADVAAYLPALGVLAIRSSARGTDNLRYVGTAGAGGLVEAPGDYDGDGKADVALYIPGYGSFTVTYSATGASLTIPFGPPGANKSTPATARPVVTVTS